MWDFWAQRPEATHQVMFLFSDRGTPDGLRHMNGYGSHTFKMVNKDGHPVYVKFHFKVDTVTLGLIKGGGFRSAKGLRLSRLILPPV